MIDYISISNPFFYITCRLIVQLRLQSLSHPTACLFAARYMPHTPLLRLQMLPIRTTRKMFGDPWALSWLPSLRSYYLQNRYYPFAALESPCGLSLLACAPMRIMNLSWQAAKRPVSFSDVAVGLCRSSNCGAQIPLASRGLHSLVGPLLEVLSSSRQPWSCVAGYAATFDHFVF